MVILFWIVLLLSWIRLALVAAAIARTERWSHALAVCIGDIGYSSLVIAFCMWLHATGTIR